MAGARPGQPFGAGPEREAMNELRRGRSEELGMSATEAATVSDAGGDEQSVRRERLGLMPPG